MTKNQFLWVRFYFEMFSAEADKIMRCLNDMQTMFRLSHSLALVQICTFCLLVKWARNIVLGAVQPSPFTVDKQISWPYVIRDHSNSSGKGYLCNWVAAVYPAAVAFLPPVMWMSGPGAAWGLQPSRSLFSTTEILGISIILHYYQNSVI